VKNTGLLHGSQVLPPAKVFTQSESWLQARSALEISTYREEEREMAPLCLDQGVGMIPWSPLARGKLARAPEAKTSRTETDQFGKRLYASMEKADAQVWVALDQVAQTRKVPHAQVALVWLLQKPGVTAPIIGATKMHHLEDAAAALELKLTSDEVGTLEAGYLAHPVAGFV
jgi:aryl-alcohol dehydrogenase-like predicted oxidoreductase